LFSIKNIICIVIGLEHYQKVFSIEQENVLVQYLKDMESRLFGLTQNYFRKLAFELAERNNIAHNFNKTNGLAGELSNDYFIYVF